MHAQIPSAENRRTTHAKPSHLALPAEEQDEVNLHGRQKGKTMLRGHSRANNSESSESRQFEKLGVYTRAKHASSEHEQTAWSE